MAWRISALPSAVRLREDYSAKELRGLARRSKDVNQSRRLLSLAAVRDGMDRGAAAKIGGMDRQTLRDWVHRFNASGPDGLLDNGPKAPSLAFRRSNWLSSRRSSRLVRIVRRTLAKDRAGLAAVVAGNVAKYASTGRRHDRAHDQTQRLEKTLDKRAPSRRVPTASRLTNRRRTSRLSLTQLSDRANNACPPCKYK